MFVYLDHAQIVELDLLLRHEPGAFAEFLGFWLDHGCRLVVSRAHLHELGQSEDDRDVEKRLEVLRYFSIWSGASDENVDWVIIRELKRQILHRLCHGTGPEPVVYAAVREELYRPVEHSALAEFVRRSRPGWLEDRRTRQEFAAFENRNQNLQRAFHRLTGRKAPKWDPEGWRLLPAVRRLAPSAHGDPVGDRWMREVESRTPECWKRARRKRQMLVCIYDVEDLDCIGRAPEPDLSRIGIYRALANHWVAPYAVRDGQDPEAVATAIRTFDPYDAPAISAALAVERGRKQHDKEYEPSDFMDVDHVLWAAYSDLAFVDKRTHGFMLQARKNRQTAPLISRHLRVRFERAADLEDVQRHIVSVARERWCRWLANGAGQLRDCHLSFAQPEILAPLAPEPKRWMLQRERLSRPRLVCGPI